MRTFYLMLPLLASAAVVVPVMPTLAATAPAVATAEADNARAFKLVEDYFNHITTLSAHFSQHSSNESWTHEGKLLIKRPRQFLWLYETPHKQRVIGTGTAVYYVDDENGQVTQMPLKGGIAKILGAAGDIDLSKLGFAVTQTHQTGTHLDVLLTPTKHDDQIKQVALGFTLAAKPVLNDIIATDNTGVITRVELSDVRAGVALDSKLFKFTPPQYRQN
jgi:outer membrane lipoprotein carrier protein